MGETRAHSGHTGAAGTNGCNSHTSDLQAATPEQPELCDEVDELLPPHVQGKLPRLHRSHLSTLPQSSTVRKTLPEKHDHNREAGRDHPVP